MLEVVTKTKHARSRVTFKNGQKAGTMMNRCETMKLAVVEFTRRLTEQIMISGSNGSKFF